MIGKERGIDMKWKDYLELCKESDKGAEIMKRISKEHNIPVFVADVYNEGWKNAIEAILESVATESLEAEITIKEVWYANTN